MVQKIAEEEKIHVSIFSVVDNVEGAAKRSQRISEVLDYTKLADKLGYPAFYYAEHHFDPHGEAPDPWLLVAAAAERTRGGSIHLGPMVSNLSFRNPIRLAEQALFANLLSDGRVEMGLGSGNIIQEHVAFGLYPDSVAKKREAFDAAFPVFLSALKGKVDTPGLPVTETELNVTCIDNPEKSIWISLSRTEVSLEFAKKGYSIVIGPPFATMHDIGELEERVGIYCNAVSEHRSSRISAAFHVYVGENTGVALKALQLFMDEKVRDGTAHLPLHEKPSVTGPTAEQLVERGLAIFGSAKEVASKLKELKRIGLSDLFAIVDFGGLERSEVEGTLHNLSRL